MSEEKLFNLSLTKDGLELVRRGGRYFLRYDAGAHQMAWREDEVGEEDAHQIASGRAAEYEVIIRLQRRLGLEANISNWAPPI